MELVGWPRRSDEVGKPVERATIQLRAEAYNLTNSLTWASPGTTVNNVSTFGVITGVAGGNASTRTMQMGVKLIF